MLVSSEKGVEIRSRSWCAAHNAGERNFPRAYASAPVPSPRPSTSRAPCAPSSAGRIVGARTRGGGCGGRSGCSSGGSGQWSWRWRRLRPAANPVGFCGIPHATSCRGRARAALAPRWPLPLGSDRICRSLIVPPSAPRYTAWVSQRATRALHGGRDYFPLSTSSWFHRNVKKTLPNIKYSPFLTRIIFHFMDTIETKPLLENLLLNITQHALHFLSDFQWRIGRFIA